MLFINNRARLIFLIAAVSVISKQILLAGIWLCVSLLIIKVSNSLSVKECPDKLIAIVLIDLSSSVRAIKWSHTALITQRSILPVS